MIKKFNWTLFISLALVSLRIETLAMDDSEQIPEQIAYLSRRALVDGKTRETCRYYQTNSCIRYYGKIIYGSAEFKKIEKKLNSFNGYWAKQKLTFMLVASGTMKGESVKYYKLSDKTFEATDDKHTEPQCLKYLLELEENYFQSLLPAEYTLNYSVIHFISHLDACAPCMKEIYKGMKNLRERFGDNLFIFFHSNKPPAKPYYPDFIYSIKLNWHNYHTETWAGKWRYIEASFHGPAEATSSNDSNENTIKIRSFGSDDDEAEIEDLKSKMIDHELDERPDRELSTIPSFYFGIIHGTYNKKFTIRFTPQKKAM